jgi:cell division protein FtsL
VVIPVASGMLGYVWLNLELVHVGYEVDRLERLLRQEEQRHRELQVETAYLSSPQQVRSRATDELGMITADLDRLVFLEEGP